MASLKKSLEALQIQAKPLAVGVSDNEGTTEEVFQQRPQYNHYPEYHDDKYSIVDSNKNVRVDPSQMNLTQEKNSQVIPFIMDRYYDGIDLSDKTFTIHYLNVDKEEGLSTPINFEYSDTKIRFLWRIDGAATAKEGKIAFEIIATGTAPGGQPYEWKTKPNYEDITILKSLAGNGKKPEEPDNWYDIFIETVRTEVQIATNAAEQAYQAATQATQASGVVLDKIATVQDEIHDAVVKLMKEDISNALKDYYTSEEINTKVDNLIEDFDDRFKDVYEKIDGIDGLAALRITYEKNKESDDYTFTVYNGDTVIFSTIFKTNPTPEWTEAFRLGVENDLIVPLRNDLDQYKTTNDVAISGIQKDLSDVKKDYITKEDANAALDEKAPKSEVASLKTDVSKLQSDVQANTSGITGLGTKLGQLEEEVDNLDKTPSKEYYATLDEEHRWTLWEVEGENETAKSSFVISGGGGGGSSTTTTVKIDRITPSMYVVTKDDKVLIEYNFSSVDSSGDDTGEGTATWKVGNTVVATSIALQGENTMDLTKYMTIGSQRISLSIVDSAGSIGTKTWTVQVVDVRLESAFNDRFVYPIGPVSFNYTPYGSVEKTVHFILDGETLDPVVTSSSGIPMSYSLPSQEHGSHLLESYITAEINGSTIETTHIFKDILWYDETKDAPVIGCIYTDVTAKQYDSTNIMYTVYDPNTETPVVTLAVDGTPVSALTLNSPTQTWQFKSADVGSHTLTISCRDTVKTIHIEVTKLDIDVEPITANLAFDFNPSGRNNSDADRLWSNRGVHMTVSDDFDWVNGGYQIDEAGDQYFCIKAGTSANIDYHLFEDDAKRNGKEFKLIFRTTNVRKANAQFLTCVDGPENAKVGVQMNVHEAYIHASADSLYLPYSEEDIIEFEFNISKTTDDISMVMGYEDGVPTRPLIYGDGHNFSQNNPKTISIGSPDCDVLIYRFKVYSAGLTDRDILNNFIADARNAEEMIDRYTRNQIYDENGMLTPEVLAEKCKELRIIKIDAPWFTNDKKDKVTGTTIEMIYKNGDPILDNWIAYNCQHSGQGTSSNEYGAAGRNLDLIMNKSGIDGVKPRIVLGDGTETTKITLTRNSVPVNYLNAKVNIASSENQNNARLQERYNKFNPYLRPIRKRDPRVKDTMEFENCVIFIRENDPDISKHREFADCEYHFYAIGNVGDSKKTDNTRVDDPEDKQECILEILDYNLPLSEFPKGEAALATLDADKFDESGTYGWRYRYESDDPEEDVAILANINEKWREFYRFVVMSTDEEFHNKLSDYFVVDSALFYYLFTERYTMCDNRAKNSFWHMGKCEDGKYRWDLCFDYDND